MTWTRTVAVIGLFGAAGLTGCASKGEVEKLRQRVQALETERDMLRTYLGETGNSAPTCRSWPWPSARSR